jgi:prepilin-type processing-associated H-X9-DG protein/prepilin-type N-terminal cleavage/methylation domain-containing protein
VEAFTLVELLTVIVIIGILFSVLIPIIWRVKSSARNATCLSNLRQIGVGIQLYATDNKGFLPVGWKTDAKIVDNRERPWMGALINPDYIGYGSRLLRKLSYADMQHCVLFCPQSIRNLSNPDNFPGTSSYAYNHNGLSPSGPQRINGCDHPARLIVVGEPSLDASGNNWSNLLANGDWSVVRLSADIHGNHSNALYLDGHVGALTSIPAANDNDFWRY